MGIGRDLRSWLLLSALLAGALVQPLACDKDPEPSAASEALKAMLAEVGPQTVIPALQRAETAAGAMIAAASAWSDAERSGSDPEQARLAAQQAWVSLMEAWQEAELHQIGPSGSSLTALGGRDLRDEIYSWPTVNPCRVDQETVYGDYASPSFFEGTLVNAYGLDALETLLYSEPGVNACPSQVDINADGTWDALGDIQQRRADYALVVAGGVADTLSELLSAWDPASGDFSGEVARAGEGSATYGAPEEALNAVFDALFYLELSTKDRKLGRPLGLVDCSGTSCVSEVESPLAGLSQRWIAANLRGFRALYAGGEGAGMDDLLREIGSGDLADEMLSALDAADAAAAALSVPIDEAALGDRQPAIDLFDAVKAVTDLLKEDIAVVLVLQVPSEAAGDND